MQDKETATFFFEMGQLFRIKREGWRMIGVDAPESVAEHSLRAAQIGWVLAHAEGYDNPHEVAAMLIFHDMGEARIGDLHKVASRYVTADEARAVEEQTSRLGSAGTELCTLWKTKAEKKSVAAIIAKDADLLEMAVRAREYIEQGYSAAQEWFESAASGVKTESAKRIIKVLPSIHSSDWLKGLKVPPT
jgi:putative hydrolase of HD superfamily